MRHVNIVKWRNERRLYKTAKAKLNYKHCCHLSRRWSISNSQDVRNQITTFPFQFSFTSTTIFYYMFVIISNLKWVFFFVIIIVSFGYISSEENDWMEWTINARGQLSLMWKIIVNSVGPSFSPMGPFRMICEILSLYLFNRGENNSFILYLV